MLQTERKCRKLHTRPYGWTPELTRMMTELQYWQSALRQVEGKPYNVRFLRRLIRALELPTRPPNETGDTIHIRLKTLKEKLKQKLGDPNRQEKWLEGLATAQTAETGGDQAKRLRHLMCTEEQRLHAWQIRRTSQTANTNGGLSAISVVNQDGTTSHHSEKKPWKQHA